VFIACDPENSEPCDDRHSGLLQRVDELLALQESAERQATT